jgi:GT2 family glycosyltransferase
MNDRPPLVSVIVITFNGMEFVEACLSSVLKAVANVPAEIIVIDNGSRDGTKQFLESRFSQVQLVCNDKNLGFAPAVNQGFAKARGKYIFLLNQDTKMDPTAITQLLQRMEKDAGIGIAGPRFIGFDGRLQKSCRAFPRYRDLLYELTGLSYLFPRSRTFARWKMGWFDHLTEREVDQPMGAALMIRRELIEKIGGFDESFGIFFNDVDFCRRAKELGYINLYYPEAVVAHFVGGSTRKMKPRMVLASHWAMYQYFRKYNRGSFGIPALYFWGGLLFLSALVRALFHIVLKR